MKIILCGFGRAGKEILLQLLLNGALKKKDVLVFTHKHFQNKEFIELLNNLDIQYSFNSINKSIKQVKSFRPDYLISAYYRYLIRKEILKILKFKGMNLHPSLLPAYKGCFSSVWAILNGETETGISFHYITDKIDGGNIILKRRLKIKKDDTAYFLYNKLIFLSVVNFNLAFKRLCCNYGGEIQNNKKSSYYKREVPFRGLLNSNVVSYEYAKRFVRAMFFPPYPGAKFIIDKRKIEIKNCQELMKYKDKFLNYK